MSKTTTAAVIRDKGGEFQLEEVTVESPHANEVLVRTLASGICHADISSRDQILPPKPPVILGHEGIGVVEALGSGVDAVSVGDRVVLTPLSCGHCRMCLRGRPMSCLTHLPDNFAGRRTDGSTGFRARDGAEVNAHYFGQSSFSGLMLTPARSLVKVDDDLPIELLAPLGCGIQTGAGAVLNVLDPEAGSSIVVVGAGSVGLAAVMAAKVARCSSIIAVDMHASRLETATELGATHTVRAGTDVVARVREITNGEGVDYSLDAVGFPVTLRTAVDVLGIGGFAGIVGAGGFGQEVSLDLSELLSGRTVRGIIQGDGVPQLFIPKLIQLYRTGELPLDKLVQTYPLAQIEQAVADSESGRTIKPVLLF